MKRTTIGLLCLMSAATYAGPTHYQCKVVAETGIASDWQSYGLLVGQTFSVVRGTGIVLGGGIDNTRSASTQVLDNGSSSSAFKMLSISKEFNGESRKVVYLMISEPDQREDKPFVAITDTEVLTGTCR